MGSADARPPVPSKQSAAPARLAPEQINLAWDPTRRALLDSLPDGYFELDLAGRLIDFNRALSELTGYLPEELAGLSYRQYIAAESAERLIQVFSRIYRTGESVRNLGFELNRKNGTSGRVEISVCLLRDPEQQPGGFRGLLRELSEQQRAEHALQKSEEKWKRLFAILPVGVSILDSQAAVIDMNPTLERILGITQRDLVDGSYSRRIFLSSDGTLLSPAEFPSARAVHEQKIIEHIEVGVVKEDGVTIWTDVSAAPLPYPDASCVIVTADITERKQAEQVILRRNTELSALTQMSQVLSRRAEPAALWEHLFTTIGLVLDNRNLYIALNHERDQMISFPVYTIDGERIQPPARAYANGLTEYIIRTKAPLFLPRDFARAVKVRDIEPHGRSALCYLGVPMLMGDHVSGVIAVQDYEREGVCDQVHLELLTIIASQAAITLENARLFTEYEQLSRTDSLTGLANRRHLLEVGATELSSARRFGHPLSALMLDIDHFKYVNDTHGHAQGDLALKALAQCCLQQVRGIDIVGRYGGEEFVILLIETDPAGARNLAERIRESVAQIVIPTAQGSMCITASVGIAQLSEADHDLYGLLGRADQALYSAKQAGRNRVVVG